MEKSMQFYHPAFGCPGAGPHHRREDGQRRIMRYLMVATYVSLIVTLIVFIGVASAEYNNAAAAGWADLSGQMSAGWSVFMFAYVQIMAAGLFVGLVGAFLHHRYTLRRRDRHYGGQLLCVFVSVLGLALYFVLV